MRTPPSPGQPQPGHRASLTRVNSGAGGGEGLPGRNSGRVSVCEQERLSGLMHRESRRCSRDTYPESYITKYTSIRR